MKNLQEIINESVLTIDQSVQTELIAKLNVAFAEEMNAWYGYIITKDYLVGGERSEIADFYEDAAKDEYEDHAMWLLERINQLSGCPCQTLALSDINTVAAHKYILPVFTNGKVAVHESLNTNILNEKGAIETYQDLEKFTRDIDPATNRKMKEILSDEQDHLNRLVEFLDDYNANKSK